MLLLLPSSSFEYLRVNCVGVVRRSCEGLVVFVVLWVEVELRERFYGDPMAGCCREMVVVLGWFVRVLEVDKERVWRGWLCVAAVLFCICCHPVF